MKKLAVFSACTFPALLVSACLAACVVACENHVPRAEQPVPPQMLKDYIGMKQENLIRKLGPADMQNTVAGEKGTEGTMLYHWHTRDAVTSAQMDYAWRNNTAFTQRQLPTRSTPLLRACDVTFTLRNGIVTDAQPKGVCW